MRIHKYFRRRSHTRLHSSSTSSFSSNSSSSLLSSLSFSATSSTNGNNDSESPVKGSNKTKKRSSWWKRHSFVSKTRKSSETKQKHDKPPKRSNRSCENEQFHNRYQQKEPLISSTELVKALDYFEIKEDLNPTLVKKKYKKLCLIHHPDRNGNNEESIQEMQTINHYFDILQEELQTTNDDPSLTRKSNYKSSNNSKENRKHVKRRSSHNHRHTFVRRSKRGQKRDSRIHTKNPLGDVLLDVALSFLVGRFVIGTGWVTSALMIGLAQLLQGGKDNKSTTTTRLSKSLFFALHTGWFLLLECLETSQTLIGELPWQLKLVGLATFCSSFLEDHRDTPLKCLTTAILETESSLIGIFDWILSNNRRYKNSDKNIPMQTIADFGVLSIAFLFGKIVYCALS